MRRIVLALAALIHGAFQLASAELEDLEYRLAFPGNPGHLDRRSRRDVWRTIRRLKALQRQGIYVMGATNRIRVRGTPMQLPITAGGVTAGSPAVIGGAIATALAGVVESAKDANNNAVVHFEGVWSISFTSVGAVAIGDPIYVTAAGVLQQSATSAKLFGHAVNAQAGTTTALLSIRLATGGN